jgi:hypothetical protein
MVEYLAGKRIRGTSSERIGADMTETFDDAAPWTQTGTLVAVDAADSNKLEFLNANNGTDRRVEKALAATLNDSLWIADFIYRFSAGTAPSHAILAFSSDIGNPNSVSADAIYVFHNSDVSNELQISHKDGQTGFGTVGGYIPISVNTTYYVRLQRTSSTNIRLSIFSDSSRLTHVPSSPINVTIASTISALDVVGAYCNGVGSPTRHLTAYVDTLNIYNNQATISSNFQDGTVFEETDTNESYVLTSGSWLQIT